MPLRHTRRRRALNTLRGQPRRTWLAVGALVVACLSLLAVLVLWPAAPPPYRPAGNISTGTVQAAHHPDVLFLGDSYTGGSDQGGMGLANYVVRLGQAQHWATAQVAVGGTGYVHRGGPRAAPFQEAQLPAVQRFHPAYVVIVGSRNDTDAAPADIRRAASSLYASIRRFSPNTRIVVVGPIWSNGAPTAGVLAARDAVGAAAQDAQVPFTDPIAEHWFADRPDLIGADRVHPTDAGHAYLADRMAAALAAAGVTPPRVP